MTRRITSGMFSHYHVKLITAENVRFIQEKNWKEIIQTHCKFKIMTGAYFHHRGEGGFYPFPTNTFLIFSVTVDVMTSKFCDFLFYLLATFLQNFMLRDSINSKLWYLCWDYIQFRYFSPVSILCKISLCSLDIEATGSWNVVHCHLRAVKTKVNNHRI